MIPADGPLEGNVTAGVIGRGFPPDARFFINVKATIASAKWMQ